VIRYHAVITSRALRFLDGVVAVVAVTISLLNVAETLMSISRAEKSARMANFVAIGLTIRPLVRASLQNQIRGRGI